MATFLECVPWYSFKKKTGYGMSTRCMYIKYKRKNGASSYLSFSSALLIWWLSSSWCLNKACDAGATTPICFLYVHHSPGQRSIYFVTDHDKLSSRRVFPLSWADFFALLIIRQLFRALRVLSWEVRQWFRVPIFRWKNILKTYWL